MSLSSPLGPHERAEQNGASAGLQRRGHDLCRAGRATVDKDNQGDPGVAVPERVEHARHGTTLVVAHDRPAVEERRGGLDSLVDETTGIVPEVEDETSDVVGAGLAHLRTHPAADP